MRLPFTRRGSAVIPDSAPPMYVMHASWQMIRRHHSYWIYYMDFMPMDTVEIPGAVRAGEDCLARLLPTIVIIIRKQRGGGRSVPSA